MESEQTGRKAEQTDASLKKLDPNAVSASRKKLVTLILIAFVPIFIAYTAFFYFPALAPEGTTNRGQLVSPPVQGETISQQLAAQRSWVLIQSVGEICDESCEQLLYLSRQVTAGLGKDAGRVKRVVLTGEKVSSPFLALLSSEHRDIVMIEADAAALLGLTSVRPVLFLMDPNANVMMYFTLEQAGKPMLRDLKHLLKISNIG